MKVPWALLAHYANLSTQGELNIMGIFDHQAVTSSFPTALLSVHVVYPIVTSPAERGTTKTMAIKLLDADGHQLMDILSTVELSRDLPAHQAIPQILELNAVVIPAPGDYTFSILVNGEEKATAPFSVVQGPAAQAG